MVLWLGEGDAYALLGELLRAEYGLGVLPAMARGGGGGRTASLTFRGSRSCTSM